jgi:UDP:flavonoid glycosyltransferase YjiC (YdhE family)
MRVGVPLVVAGEGQDKPVTNAIIGFKGVGINLGTQKPAAEDIGAAVGRVLEEKGFKTKAQEMSKIYAEYDVGGTFDGLIKDVVRDFQHHKREAA